MSDLAVFATRLDGWKIFALASVGVLAFAVLFPTRLPSPLERHEQEMEAKLEEAWRERHPGAPLPDACEHDQVRAGWLDVDDAPGPELVIASDRLGIAVFTEVGGLLAMADPRGCRSTPANWWFNDALGNNDRLHGIVLREEVRGCRSSTWVTLLHRRGDTLDELARYREQDSDQCRWNGTSGYSVTRRVKDVSVSGTSLRGFAVKLRVWERCSGGSREECETDKAVEYDCAFRGAWVSPSCLPLVGDRPRKGPLVEP